MRDIKRIDRICNLLAKCGKKYDNDMRFGQFLNTFIPDLMEKHKIRDIGHYEDTKKDSFGLISGEEMLDDFLEDK